MKAAMMRLGEHRKTEAVIRCYDTFLDHAPADERKVLESHYAIAMCVFMESKGTTAEVVEWYNRGL